MSNGSVRLKINLNAGVSTTDLYTGFDEEIAENGDDSNSNQDGDGEQKTSDADPDPDHDNSKENESNSNSRKSSVECTAMEGTSGVAEEVEVKTEEVEVKEEAKEDTPDPENLSRPGSGLLNVSIATHTDKARKRKHIKTNFENAKLPTAVLEAQQREKERLERQKMRHTEENDHISQMAALIPPGTLPEVVIMDDDFMDDLELAQKRHDVPTTSKDPEVIELSSDDEDVVPVGNASRKGPEFTLSYGRNLPSGRGRWSSYQEEAAKADLLQQRDLEQKRLRKRRKSGDLESKELTEGKLLVNAGKPDCDEDIFVASHLTHTLQPHQLGGIRFMYDNVIESMQEYKKSEGFGCILAHSMGLGKTIQVITFTEIFFRATKAHKVLVIVPINTIQNWLAEFNKWMPEWSVTGERIRKFKVFILGDSVKVADMRVRLVEEWHRDGGVLLIGYEMFRILLKTVVPGKKKTKARLKIKLNSQNGHGMNNEEDNDVVDDVPLPTAKSKADNEKLRAALLDPGPDLVICDEGHKIKNLNTNIAAALMEIRSKRRIVLTGYPLQNNLMEYFCMVDFVRPMYLGTKKSFAQMFEKPIKNGQCVDSTYSDQKLAAARTHVLKESLKGFVQRRTHALLKQILPQCREYVVLLRKSPIQHVLYRNFVLYAQSEMATGNNSTFNPLKAFSACCKIWNHPDVLHLWLQRRKELDAKIAENNRPPDPPPPPTAPSSSMSLANVLSNGQGPPNFGGPGPSGFNMFGNCHPPPPYPMQQHPMMAPPSSSYSLMQKPFGQAIMSALSFNPQFPSQPHPMGSSPFPQNQSMTSPFQNMPMAGSPYSQNQSMSVPTPTSMTSPFPNMPMAASPFTQNQSISSTPSSSMTSPFPNMPMAGSPYSQNQPMSAPPPPMTSPFPNMQNQSMPATPMTSSFPMTSAPLPDLSDLDRIWRDMSKPGDFMQQQNLSHTIDLSSSGDSSTNSAGLPGSANFYGYSSQGQSQPPPQPTGPPGSNYFGGTGGSLPDTNQEKKKPGPRAGNGGQKKATLASILQEELELDTGLKYDWAEMAMQNFQPGNLENGYKLTVAFTIIDEATRRGEKILLFSQNLTTLSIIENYLARSRVNTANGPGDAWQKGMNYFRFDGQTNGQEREKLINRFNSDPNVALFLISTRAGSLGINLVSANRCILFDACWNPCHDAQAVCRVYRYGQQRRTYIYRLILDNSMEKAIFNRQISKNGLQQRVVDDLQVEANITQRELETLLVYDESLDVVMGDHNTTEWELDDDVLKTVVDKHSRMFAAAPFLHESLMLEREDQLSEQEKLEAQLLFEKERASDLLDLNPLLDPPTNYGGMPLGSRGLGRFPGQPPPYLGMKEFEPPALRSAPMPRQLQSASSMSFRGPHVGGGGATLASLRDGSFVGGQNPFHHDPRMNLSVGSFLRNAHSKQFLESLRALPGIRLIGDPITKTEGTIQKIVSDHEMMLRIVSDLKEPEPIPAGTEIFIVLTPNGTYAKGPNGKVYTCQGTPLDLGGYTPMIQSRSLKLPPNSGRLVRPMISNDVIQLDDD